MRIASFSVNRPITTLMAVLSVIVVGAIALGRIPLEYLPQFSSHRLRIRVVYRSSSPEEIERLITRPIEEAMGTVKGVDELRSRSSNSTADVSLLFKPEVDMDIAAMEVRDRLDRVRPLLPEDVSQIRLYRWQSTDLPVIEFSVSSIYGKTALQDVVEHIIVRRLQRLEGVANVQVQGYEERELTVDLILARMKAHGVEPYNIRRALRNNNLNLSAGYITEGGRRYVVRALGEIQSPRDLERLPLKRGQVRLGDVAEIRYGFPKKRWYQFLDGREAVTVRVYKSSSANLVAVARRVRKELDQLKKEPSLAGVRIYLYRDRSQDILRRLNNLKSAGITGAVFVVLVLFFFLRSVRSTLIVSFAIPLSVLCTFGLVFFAIRFFGSTFTINIVSVSGMILCLGMLVDPAIVVLENIFRLRQEHNLSKREAAIVGANQVAVAITAATATTMCVFTPMMFFSHGWLWAILSDIGLVICLALPASLTVAVTLIPLVSSRVLGVSRSERSWLIRQLRRWYERLISFTLRHRTGMLTIAFVISAFSFYVYSNLGRSYRIGHAYRRVRIRVDTPRTFELDDTRRVFERIQEVLEAKRHELEIDTVSCYFDRGGGMLDIFLTDEDQAKRSVEELKEAIKQALPQIVGVRYRAGRLWGRGGEQIGVEINLQGPRLNTLERLAELVKERIESIPYLSDVDTSLERGQDEIRAEVDRTKAQAYGLSPQRVAWGVAAALSTRAASKFKTKDREIDIQVQLREEDRVSLEQLKNFEFESASLEHVTFARLARFRRVRAPRTISRRDRQAIVSVVANCEPRRVYVAKAAITRAMADFPMPPGYSWSFPQSWRERREKRESLFGLYLAAILVYMIMASLFESLVHPLVIMLSIPFALTGVSLVFWLTDNPLDPLANAGMLLLCGLVVNNGIVLIDYINRLRSEGLDRRSAIIRGGSDRLRPILMTTLTTLLGLLPMVMPLLVPAITRAFDLYAPTFLANLYHQALDYAAQRLPSVFGPIEGRDRAWTSVGLILVSGLTTSTILTLVVMPTVYSVIDDIGRWVKRVFVSA